MPLWEPRLNSWRGHGLDTCVEFGEGGGGLVTRAVHNRAAACVAAGGGIFENQL